MMSDKKYLFNGKDISINVYVQIRTVVNVIMERTQKTFMEAVEIFYDSETYKQLQHTENGFWAESPDYIADEFFRERMNDRCRNKEGNNMEKILYHGSSMIVSEPEIRKARYTKDFSWGFYCTERRKQAETWSIRHSEIGYLNIYEFRERSDLKIKHFSTTDSEWLDFIAKCRNGGIHEYDIVEGPMADDTIYNYVEDYLDDKITKDDFLQLAKFKHPTHQISFHTIKALSCLEFIKAEEMHDEDE